jgi:hypothetical protein
MWPQEEAAARELTKARIERMVRSFMFVFVGEKFLRGGRSVKARVVCGVSV